MVTVQTPCARRDSGHRVGNHKPQPDPVEAIVLEGPRLPAGLAEADRLLDDPRFFTPFRPFFDPSHGRPPIPMETYVRMMFLN